jgi:hypothetical protein
LPIAYTEFLEECIDTCNINFNLTNISLIIELSENSTLSIDSIVYAQEVLVNDTNITVETIQYPAHVGEPVKWMKKASRATVGEISVEIPVSAYDISTYKILDKKHKSPVTSEIEQPRKKLLGKGAKSADIGSTLTITEPSADVEIEYYTEAPIYSELNVSNNQKMISVASDTHYTNVTVYSMLPSEISDVSKILLMRQCMAYHQKNYRHWNIMDL